MEFKSLYAVLLVLLFQSITTYGQIPIAKQSFETSGDTWIPLTFSTPPCTNGNDRWDYSTSLSSIAPSDLSRFWGIQDLNGNCGGSGFETISLPNVDVSSYTNVNFSFDYNVIGYDNGDDIKYELFYDNVSQGQVIVVNGSGNYSTGGWVTETVAIPNTVTNVRVDIMVKQNGGSDYGGIDKVWLYSTSCSPEAEPTVGASSLSYSNIACNSYTVSWTNGNGNNRIVVMSTSPIAGAPVDQTQYSANSSFGSGSTIAAGEFVVYNGSGNAVTVSGLSPNTTYYTAVFEYNVTITSCTENYLTSASLGSQNTSTCVCPYVETILVNACGGSEGINEYVVFKTGNSPLNVDDIKITFDTQGSYCNNGCGSNTIVNNTTYTNQLNATAGCSKFAYMDPIPANTTVIFFTGQSPSFNYDFSAMCNGTNVAVIYCNNTNTIGRFSNNSGTKNTTLDWGGTCSETVTYDASNINTDGDFANFDVNGNVSYGNNPNCTAIQLPVELASFDVSEQQNANLLEWEVYSESEIDHYSIYKSSDGYRYDKIAEVNAVGTTNESLLYSTKDLRPENGLLYYKLETTNLSGEHEVLAIETITRKGNKPQIINREYEWGINSTEPVLQYTVYSVSGEKITETYNLNSKSITIDKESFPQGVYMIKLKTMLGIQIVKVVR